MTVGYQVICVMPAPEEFHRIRGILHNEGIEAHQASCLLGAVLAHTYLRLNKESEAPPIVLYDTDAPGHWRQALGEFLRLHPETHVIFLSRTADESMWIQVLDTGGYDLLSKPASSASICAAVFGALRSVDKHRVVAA